MLLNTSRSLALLITKHNGQPSSACRIRTKYMKDMKSMIQKNWLLRGQQRTAQQNRESTQHDYSFNGMANFN